MTQYYVVMETKITFYRVFCVQPKEKESDHERI
nr:MAG TPA: hypothetical protein [Caudoviricetes sp.]